jgi:hypothetical protein
MNESEIDAKLAIRLAITMVETNYNFNSTCSKWGDLTQEEQNAWLIYAGTILKTMKSAFSLEFRYPVATTDMIEAATKVPKIAIVGSTPYVARVWEAMFPKYKS